MPAGLGFFALSTPGGGAAGGGGGQPPGGPVAADERQLEDQLVEAVGARDVPQRPAAEQRAESQREARRAEGEQLP